MKIKERWVQSLAALALLGGLISADASDMTDAQKATLRRGVELHDAGNYRAAIGVYQSLVDEDPKNSTALYEMAYSYEALQDFTNCERAAQRSADIKSNVQGDAFAMLANCQDESGRREDAFKTYKRGLRKYPKHPMLNFNYAIALAASGNAREAGKALRTAISENPRYPSSYKIYATLLDQQGAQGAAEFMWLRFIMAEPQSDRAIDAANRVIEPFASAIAGADASKQINLTMPAPRDQQVESTDFTPMSLALSMSNSAKPDTDGNVPSSPTIRFVTATKTFLGMASLMGDDATKNSFVWQNAVRALERLNDQGVLDTFLIHVATLARIEDAATLWNAAPDEEQARLGAALSEIASLRAD
jgi:tetratricopeptide (TPR) repeat protein